MKYKYIVKNLKNEKMGHADNIPDICRKFNLSFSVVESRLKRKVNKYDTFKKEKNKINIERITIKE